MRPQPNGATGSTSGAADTSVEDALVQRLRELQTDLAVRPDADYRAATRARLVAMAAVRTPATPAGAPAAGVRRPAPRRAVLARLLAAGAGAPATRWRSRVTAGLAGAALTITALGGLLAASAGARPGDLLYEVKRGGEHTQLALAGDSTRGHTLLDFASTRLAELTGLLGGGAPAHPATGGGSEVRAVLAAGPDVPLIVGTLTTMDDQTTRGARWVAGHAVDSADQAALTGLTRWATGQRSGLGALAATVPAGADTAYAASTELLDAVAARGSALQDALACPAGPAIAGTDDLGPLPAPCPPPGAATGSSTRTRTGSGTPTTEARGPGADAAAPGEAARTAAALSAPAGQPTTANTPSTATTAATATAGATRPSTSPGEAGRTPPGSPPVGTPGPTHKLPLPLPVPLPLPLPHPGLPHPPPVGTAPTPAPPSSVVQLPPVVPGVTICLPPILTVGC